MRWRVLWPCLPTRLDVISDKEYNKLRPLVVNALPTMKISTIKYDNNVKPNRLKWIILALGNLYPHEWKQNECYAPLLSMIEIRFPVSLVVNHRSPLQKIDMKQAFYKAILPTMEKYVLILLEYCTTSNTNT